MCMCVFAYGYVCVHVCVWVCVGGMRVWESDSKGEKTSVTGTRVHSPFHALRHSSGNRGSVRLQAAAILASPFEGPSLSKEFTEALTVVLETIRISCLWLPQCGSDFLAVVADTGSSVYFLVLRALTQNAPSLCSSS